MDSTLWTRLSAAWNYELISFDDHPITVAKLVVALVLILIGIRLARRSSYLLGHSVLPRFGISIGEAAAMQALAFYGLITIFTVIALHVVHVPITIFSILGGAVAIGIGFGSQNIVNNFISGLILLFERPVRVGDVIEIEGITGKVLEIGTRSTRLQTGDNRELIVPNSLLLEKSVANWTLSDERVRISVSVNVSYDADPDKVKLLLLGIAHNHPGILTSPAPFVVFADFGDSGLRFDLYFWVTLSEMVNRIVVQSEVRFEIHRRFGEEKIAIPYPQRTLSIDPKQPLEVRVTR